MLQVSDKLVTFDPLLDARVKPQGAYSEAWATRCDLSDISREGSYFGVSFSNLLVGGVLSVITPTPLSVNT